MTRRLVARLQIARPLTRYPERPVWALFMFLNGFATIALLAAVAMVSGTRSTATRSASHAGTARCGCSACGTRRRRWRRASPAARVGAPALSLASTGALMILLKAAHPPAGATTLIISLGT